MRARRDLAAYDAESQRLREQRVAAQSNLANARDRLEKSQGARSRSSKEADGAVRALRTAVASLPDQLRIKVALPDHPLDIKDVALTGLDAA